MSWGSAYETNREIKRSGRTPPEGSLNRPEIPPHLLFIWEAFWDLSSERQISMAAGPIPHGAIRAYAAEYQLGDAFYETFRGLIRDMDRAFLGKVNPKAGSTPLPGVRDTVKMTDVAGVSNLLKRLQKPDPPAE